MLNVQTQRGLTRNYFNATFWARSNQYVSNNLYFSRIRYGRSELDKLHLHLRGFSKQLMPPRLQRVVLRGRITP